MVKNRSEVPVEDRWNVEALYPDEQIWKVELAEVRGEEGGSRWPHMRLYKGRLSNPEDVAALFESYLEIQRKLKNCTPTPIFRSDEDLATTLLKAISA